MNTYFVAVCSLSKVCSKCKKISNGIAIRRKIHTTLYCDNCGSYIKHASQEDIRHTYAKIKTVTDDTPMALAMLYVESQKTTIR